MIDLSPSRPKLSLLFAPLLLLAVACSEQGPAGPGSRDSGVGADSGMGIPLDAGYLARDAELDDAASASDAANTSDAGLGGVDASRTDTGVVAADAGSSADAGFIGNDAAAADSGVAVDAGSVMSDAGIAPDAGAPAPDAGAANPDAGAANPDAGVDSDAGPGVGSACDVLTQNCPGGLGCYLVSLTPLPEVWQCFAAGSVPFGGSCSTQSECGPGAVCLNGAGYGCMQVCRYPNGPCNGGLPCQPLSPNGTHGYCRSEP